MVEGPYGSFMHRFLLLSWENLWSRGFEEESGGEIIKLEAVAVI